MGVIGFQFAKVTRGDLAYCKVDKHWKYLLKANFECQIPIRPKNPIITEFIELYPDGRLLLKENYASDGPSWPAISTRNFMAGAWAHDALYQLLRMDKLHPKYREVADQILYEVIRGDGMSRPRAWWVYRAVRRGAWLAARPGSQKPVRIIRIPGNRKKTGDRRQKDEDR